jgi:hypothetical protein
MHRKWIGFSFITGVVVGTFTSAWLTGVAIGVGMTQTMKAPRHETV